MITFSRLKLLALVVLALTQGCFDMDFDNDPNENTITNATNIDNIYTFTDSSGNVVERVVLGCFRPRLLTDYQSCYAFSPQNLPICDLNSNPASNQCILGDAWASNPGLQSHHGGVTPAHSGSNVFGIGIYCYNCQYVLLDEGIVGGGQANFTPPVQQVSIWVLAHKPSLGTSYTNYAYLNAYDSHGEPLYPGQAAVTFIPQSGDFESWHQLTYTSSSNNIAFARFSTTNATANNAVNFQSEFDDLCAATNIQTVPTPFGNVTGCDFAASLPPAPSVSIGTVPGRTPGAVLTSSVVQGRTVHTAERETRAH